MPLDRYRAKRDFARTPEPSPATPVQPGRPGDQPPRLAYVVQQHAASRMHWDFRLELDGVLVSWAVPKGPSLDPKDKRLAVHVEDHPLDYAGFEGSIPAPEYGAGTVIVWDNGTWEPHGDPNEGMARGDFKFHLSGSKLTGEWVLVRMKPRPGEKSESWLLIKERDDHVRSSADFDVVKAEPRSVLSGRTIEQVAAEDADPVAGGAAASGTTESARIPGPADTTDLDAAVAVASGAVEAPMPREISPELARLAASPPPGDDWISEVKYDGYRIVVFIDGGSARAVSRNGHDWSEQFEPVLRRAELLPVKQAILDGEVVVFGDDGITSFQMLQTAIRTSPDRLTYACFDLLYLDGYDLRGSTLTTRKSLLAAVLAGQPPTGALRFAEHVDGLSGAFYERACAIGLEGVVLKRRDSGYSGTRSGDWVKVKCRLEQEFVIGGFTDPKGARTGFGALLLGYWRDGSLVYAGRVGTGFTESALSELHGRLLELQTDEPAYADPPRGAGIHWVKPELVAQVAFMEWTGDGSLRHPSYLGLRSDKAASDVVRETPGPAGTPPGDGALGEPATQPATGGRSADVAVAGVRISSPDKRLFPESATTKADLARYYEAIAPWMMPHVGERVLTLMRCPSGDGAECFWQRHPDRGNPGQVRTLTFTWPGDEEPQAWLYIDDVSGLVATAQMGVAEIHTWLSSVDTVDHPDRIIFDLDPGPDVPMSQIRQAALLVRERLASVRLTPYLKTTGGKGLHVVVPIEPVYDFEKVRAWTKAIVDGLVRDDPAMFVGRMAKAERTGRVFLDYLRNALGATAVAPYSPRARAGAPVSVPIGWDELTDDLEPAAFTTESVLRRVESMKADPWAAMDDHSAGVRVLRSAIADLLG